MPLSRAYFARCYHQYDSRQDNRDRAHIHSMGFELVDPAAEKEVVQEMRSRGASSEEVMEYFCTIVSTCHLLIFRALPGSGRIPAGVAQEIAQADRHGMPILELPNLSLNRTMSVEETRAYLREVGQR